MAEEDGNIVAARDMGPGYAWLFVDGIWSAQTRFTVRSIDAQQRHSLGRGGWQDAPDQLVPKEIRHVGSASQVLLGPEVCDHMQPMHWYDLTLNDTDKSRSFQNVSWPTVPLAGRSRQGAFIVAERRPAAREAAAAIRPAPSMPVPPPSQPSLDQAAEASAAIPSDADLNPGGLPPSPATAPASGRKRRFLVVTALVLLPLLLILAASIAYFSYGCRWDPLQCGVAEVAEVVPEGVAPDVQPAVAEAAPVAPPAVSAPPDGPEQWWAIIRNPETSADALMELGRRLQASGGDTRTRDIGYEAIYAAAEAPRNSVEAQYLVASGNDPLNPDVGEAAANPVTALTFYERAKANGSVEAPPRLAALCAWAAQRQAGSDQSIREAYESHCR